MQVTTLIGVKKKIESYHDSLGDKNVPISKQMVDKNGHQQLSKGSPNTKSRTSAKGNISLGYCRIHVFSLLITFNVC